MPHGEIIGFAPPLVTTGEEVDRIIDISHKAVLSVMEELNV